jgi:hypothetical protein
MAREIHYRGCVISHDPKPIPIRSHDWDWYSDEMGADAASGSEASVDACKYAIDEMLDDLAEQEAAR